MSRLTDSPAWKALAAHHACLEGRHLRELFAADPRRFDRFSLEATGLLIDYSKNRITEETLALLVQLARQAELPRWIERLLGGDLVNHTEQRAALHTALRADRPVHFQGRDVLPDVQRVLEHMRRFSDAVRSGNLRGITGKPFTDVVNIGIGGSDLGPAMATEALRPYGSPELRVRFVSNVDGSHLTDTLAGLDPETTLFIVASKTFTTQETLANARSAREWLLQGLRTGSAVPRHFVAVSTNGEEVQKFGIAPHNMFEFWDWVGGRYSLWSAIGLPLCIAVGFDRFAELLAGARAMDRHFAEAPLEKNAPVILGLLAVWYANFLGVRSHAVLPYDQHLARLPAYLQQLEMESLGKQVDRDGRTVDYQTGVVLWGEPGTNGQHAFFQLLHQGTQLVSADFLVGLKAHHPLAAHQRMLIAHCFAQTEALMRGKTEAEARAELEAKGMGGEALERLLPYQVFPGNRPSTTLVYEKLTPYALGALLALYEHKVFVESVILHINPFDQWGVELGKQLAKSILPELEGPAGPTAAHDASTRGLIDYARSRGV
ncbi:glucose-6-phosphate isomerase [Pelomicrobium sp. G1]|uniref:glucose-6-phosphate isomerase n=1 Tax=unclassified Pelomicrobium TaxID=2815318 RepID=UPI003F775E87